MTFWMCYPTKPWKQEGFVTITDYPKAVPSQLGSVGAYSFDLHVIQKQLSFTSCQSNRTYGDKILYLYIMVFYSSLNILLAGSETSRRKQIY